MTNFLDTLTGINKNKYKLHLDIAKWDIEGKITEFDCSKSYVLKGEFGSGKTTLALQLSKKWLEKVKEKNNNQKIDFEWYVRLIHFADLCDLIVEAQLCKGNAKAELKTLREEFRYLIIDDFGAGCATDFRLPYLERFLDERCQENMITVFTTNQNMKDWDEKFGACRSRIFEIVGTNNIFDLGKRDKRMRTQGLGVCNFDFNFISSDQKVSLQPETITEDEIFENPMLYSFENWNSLLDKYQKENKSVKYGGFEMQKAKEKWNQEN